MKLTPSTPRSPAEEWLIPDAYSDRRIRSTTASATSLGLAMVGPPPEGQAVGQSFAGPVFHGSALGWVNAARRIGSPVSRAVSTMHHIKPIDPLELIGAIATLAAGRFPGGINLSIDSC